jgi:hypothetical protein
VGCFVGVGVADGRVGEGVTWGSFVGDGAKITVGVGVGVSADVTTEVIVGISVFVCPGAERGVRVGCKVFSGAVAVISAVLWNELVRARSGVTLGTGSMSCTSRVERPFQATGVPKSE